MMHVTLPNGTGMITTAIKMKPPINEVDTSNWKWSTSLTASKEPLDIHWFEEGEFNYREFISR